MSRQRRLVVAHAEEAASCLERTVEHLTGAQRALVAQVSRELPGLAGDLPVVFRHGDYSPRNWLWDAERGTHGLIDFERSDHGVAVEDFVWLCGAVWPTRTDLKTAFLAVSVIIRWVPARGGPLEGGVLSESRAGDVDQPRIM